MGSVVRCVESSCNGGDEGGRFRGQRNDENQWGSGCSRFTGPRKALRKSVPEGAYAWVRPPGLPWLWRAGKVDDVHVPRDLFATCVDVPLLRQLRVSPVAVEVQNQLVVQAPLADPLLRSVGEIVSSEALQIHKEHPGIEAPLPLPENISVELVLFQPIDDHLLVCRAPCSNTAAPFLPSLAPQHFPRDSGFIPSPPCPC
mmetsp:Transcript_24103/g.47314  ORF Transcript_24103/g.47314 Transcript_24103/m.47314 type:complete len:200 (+) Transcript_24103:1420-2019(+)